jgi:hypothetical protein
MARARDNVHSETNRLCQIQHLIRVSLPIQFADMDFTIDRGVELTLCDVLLKFSGTRRDVDPISRRI